MRNHTTGASGQRSRPAPSWALDGLQTVLEACGVQVTGRRWGRTWAPRVPRPGACGPLLARWTCRRSSDGAPGRAGPQVRYPTRPLGKRAKGPAGRRVPWAGPETPR